MSRVWLQSLLFVFVVVCAGAVPTAPARAQSVIPGPETGYVPEPILAPQPDIFYYTRPTFIRIRWPLIPDRFCSQDEKATFLRDLDRMLETARANLQLAQAQRDNIAGSLRILTARGSGGSPDGYRLELQQLELLVDYHQAVVDAWTKIRARLAATPVSRCDPETSGPRSPTPPPLLPMPELSVGLEGFFYGPILPPMDPRLPEDYRRPDFAPIDFVPIARRFCSEAEKAGYLALVGDIVARAQVNYSIAHLAAYENHLRVEALKAAGQTAEAEALNSEQSALSELRDYHGRVFSAWLDIQERMTAMAVVACDVEGRPGRPVPPPPSPPPSPPSAPPSRPFVQPSQTIYLGVANVLNLPDIPESFCSDAERQEYLKFVLDPQIGFAELDVEEAEARLARYEAALQRARSAGLAAAAIRVLDERVREQQIRISYLNARLEGLRDLRLEVLKMPLVACDPPREASPPAADPPAPQGDTAPPAVAPPRPLAQPSKDPYGNPFNLPDIPERFCTEAERLAYLTDVYHPLAQAASSAAVDAYRRLAELTSRLEGMLRSDPSDPRAEGLRDAIAQQRIDAAYLAERARLLIALRQTILRIPVVPCPKDDAAPPPADPAPAQVAAGPRVRPSTSLEAEVLAEINLLRSDPAGYARLLPGVIRGARPADVQAAVQALKAASPAPPLTFNQSLAGAAISHADDIGPAGLTGHTGTDGSTLGARIREFGLIASLTAEELSYGQGSARAVVVQFVIDAGVAGAPHRRDLLNPVFRMAGVGCGPHKSFGKMCVITLSGPPVDRSG